MSFTNVYYKRQTGTPKACYVCYKPTTTVLATIDTVDFVYTCLGHLTDYAFATKLDGSDSTGTGQKVNLSEEEIAKIKAEWEEKQKKKAEREKEKEKEAKEKAENDKGEDKDKKDKDAKGSKSSTPKTPASPPQPATPKPTHERYALHRDFFAMRQAEHRKRRQAAQAKALAPQLPRAPTGSLEDKY